MDNDPEGREAVDKVLDALGNDYTPEQWLRVGIAISSVALGHMGEDRDLIRGAFDRAISREMEWFAESAHQKAIAKARLN
jgi:hypothetical protein